MQNSSRAPEKLEKPFSFYLICAGGGGQAAAGSAVRGAVGIHWLGGRHVGPGHHRRREAQCCFYPLRKGRLTIFIFLLNLEISDNAGRLGSGCQRPMWKSLRRRGGAEGRRVGGSEGEESGQGDAPGNPGRAGRRKLFGIARFLPAPCTGGTRIPPPVGWGSSGAGWPRRAGAVLAPVPPASGGSGDAPWPGRRCPVTPMALKSSIWPGKKRRRGSTGALL